LRNRSDLTCDGYLQVKKIPKVNATTHIRLQAATMAAVDSEKVGPKKDGEAAEALLGDDRFNSLFEDADFAIDERSGVYKELHPNAGACTLASGSNSVTTASFLLH
jgi:hypothetical protein